jgi:hypothetical protein
VKPLLGSREFEAPSTKSAAHEFESSCNRQRAFAAAITISNRTQGREVIANGRAAPEEAGTRHAAWFDERSTSSSGHGDRGSSLARPSGSVS